MCWRLSLGGESRDEVGREGKEGWKNEVALILFAMLFLSFYLRCSLVEFNNYVIKCFISLIKYL